MYSLNKHHKQCEFVQMEVEFGQVNFKEHKTNGTDSKADR